MKKQCIIGLIAIFCIGYSSDSSAQGLLKKAKQKLEQKGNDAIDGLFGGNKNKNEDSPSTNTGGGQTYPDNDRGRPSGSGDRGNRKMTPPDVNEQISDAKSAAGSQNYSDARFAIHQAIIGIEYELGEEILENMPGRLGGMSKIDDSDEIFSSGIGFVGLSISREYENNNQWAKASLVNNSAMFSSYNIILSNAAYSSQSDDMKSTKIGDYRAVMEYTSDGITIAIPIGQSSLFLLELVDIYEEDDAENLALEFDIASFKEILGEQ